MKKVLSLLMLCVSCLITAQSIEGKWNFSSIENFEGKKLISIDENDTFEAINGEFKYSLVSKDSLKAKGSYIFQNNLLIFNYNFPKDTVRYYNISELSDSTLVLSEKNILYKFTLKATTTTNVENSQTSEKIAQGKTAIIPSQGFSINSFLRGMLGMLVLLVLAFLFSSNRRAIDWKTVGLGLFFQVLIAIGVLKVSFVQKAFELVGGLFIEILNFTRAGSEFLFSGLVADTDSFGFIFAFQVLPTIIFFSALTSLLFYLGVIQIVVKVLAVLLSKILKISGAESLSVAGNIFLGQTEAPLLIKAYLEKMNKSEILLVMIGGMATVAGAVLAAYIGFLGGNDEALRLVYAKHLLAASAMAAPGAIIISKMLYPQTEKVNTDVKVSQEKIGANILDTIANGTSEGLQLAMNVAAMLLVFIAFIAMLNGGLNLIGKITTINDVIATNTAYKTLSIEFILGYTFAPLMWFIGVASEDMALMGQLLGIKLAASEFVGYIQLADLKDASNAMHLTYNKSIIMATYMLCGFANFASIGIQIGGIGSLAPTQRKTLSEFGIKALIGGTIASLMSATIAGMIIG